MRFDHDRPPQFTQGYDMHELTEPVTAEHCRWFVDEIERLRAEVAHIKEVEFPRKAQAVADGWRGKCERLEAKIEQMEKQTPAYWGPKHAIEGGSTTVIVGKFPVNPTDAPLYALPGAQNVPKEAIAKILTEVMNIAVANGANSISMPDEYVEVAAWLCGMPTQNVPNVSENYFGMTLHDKIEAMENKL